jgi:PEP-CTERM motif
MPIQFFGKAITAATLGVFACLASAQAQGLNSIEPGQFITVTNPDASGVSIPIRYQGTEVEWELARQVGKNAPLAGTTLLYGYLEMKRAGFDVSGGMTFSYGSRPFDQSGRIAYTQTLNTFSRELSVDNTDPQFVSLVSQSLGGQFTLIPYKSDGFGVSASFSDITVNFDRGEVQADISATDLLDEPEGVPAPIDNAVLWTFDKALVTGFTPMRSSSLLSADPVAALTADGYVLSPRFDEWGTLQGYRAEATVYIPELLLTESGSAFLEQIPLVAGYMLWDTARPGTGGWGSLTLRNSFYIAVPEPASYALMGLGLVGVALTARRRHQRITTGPPLATPRW